MPHRQVAALLEEWRAAIAEYDLADPADRARLEREIERLRRAYHDALAQLDEIANDLGGSPTGDGQPIGGRIALDGTSAGS